MDSKSKEIEQQRAGAWRSEEPNPSCGARHEEKGKEARCPTSKQSRQATLDEGSKGGRGRKKDKKKAGSGPLTPR